MSALKVRPHDRRGLAALAMGCYAVRQAGTSGRPLSAPPGARLVARAKGDGGNPAGAQQSAGALDQVDVRRCVRRRRAPCKRVPAPAPGAAASVRLEATAARRAARRLYHRVLACPPAAGAVFAALNAMPPRPAAPSS